MSLPAESPLRLVVLGELASGGMGRVDLARIVDGPSGRGWNAKGDVIAVKRLHPHLAVDQKFVDMFLDEVWMTGALRHPNVVELVGWGRDEEGAFLAMEFVHGASLSQVSRAGMAADQPMPHELVAWVAGRMSAALAAAHDLVGPQGEPLGMIHRDITPSNVLVGFDGSVKITDFGVAKAAGRSTNTATGILKGKISYMSPEYARGQAIDHRVDLYSLGVSLFELFAGERPFSAENELGLLRLIMSEEAPPLASLVPSIDPEIAALVHALLAKEPHERPPHAETVRRALDDWLGARGHEPAAMKRAFAAYVERHAAEQKAAIAVLLGEDEDEATILRPSRASVPGVAGRGMTQLLTVMRSPPTSSIDLRGLPGGGGAAGSDDDLADADATAALPQLVMDLDGGEDGTTRLRPGERGLPPLPPLVPRAIAPPPPPPPLLYYDPSRLSAPELRPAAPSGIGLLGVGVATFLLVAGATALLLFALRSRRAPPAPAPEPARAAASAPSP